MRTRSLIYPAALALVYLSAGPLYAATPSEIAQAEYEEVLALEPDLENGRKAYLTCAICHGPEGWGSVDGRYPQIAGQLRTVIIKQLADIRARKRDNPLMYPFSVPSNLGGPQQVADVAAYVAALPMVSQNGTGPGNDLAFGKQLYEENCVKCHGKEGEGDSKDHIPAIAGQHYNYLVRQFDLIRTNRRKNADRKMVEQIRGFSPRQEAAVLDYTSRLRPPAEKLAREGWLNPDFPDYARPETPEPPPIAAMPEPLPMPPMPAMPGPAPMMPVMPERTRMSRPSAY